jgi:hypothetical protein
MVIEELDIVIPDDQRKKELLAKEIEEIYADISFYYDRKKTITQKYYNTCRERIEDVLYSVGELSIPYFRINEDLREYYLQKFKYDPDMARDRWLERYDSLHEPYTILKNKCYLLFRKLDKITIEE